MIDSGGLSSNAACKIWQHNCRLGWKLNKVCNVLWNSFKKLKRVFNLSRNYFQAWCIMSYNKLCAGMLVQTYILDRLEGLLHQGCNRYP